MDMKQMRVEMKEKGVDMKHLRDLVMTMLGLWMVVSPRVLLFAGIHTGIQSGAIWNAWLVGAAIILVTVGSRFVVEIWSPWEDGTNAALGLWLMISPWVLGFASHVTARTNFVAVGFVVAALALWSMVMDTDLRKWMDAWMHEHHLLR
jgi:hypothetical protein